MIKIKEKIVGQKIIVEQKDISSKHKKRPLYLPGGTYRIKTHVYEHSFYVTINTLDGRPYEIFINTRNEDCVMWLASQTLSWSAIFREVSDLTFLIKGMLKVVDPKGAHQAHERFHKSIVAEIGYILDCNIKKVPLKKSDRLAIKEIDNTKTIIPANAGIECPKCKQFTLVKRDGCDKCLNEECQHSSCE